MEEQTFVVRGLPRPLSRPVVKTYQPKKPGTPQRTYAYIPRPVRQWQSIIRQHVQDQPPIILRPPIHADLRFFRPDRRLVGVDNLAAAVLNALEGLCYHVDEHVRSVLAVLYTRQPQPGVIITLRELSPREASPPDQLTLKMLGGEPHGQASKS